MADASRARRLRTLMQRHGDALVTRVAAGTPLGAALALLQLPQDLALDLVHHPRIQAALARRQEDLRGLLSDEAKHIREGAETELRALHGWRDSQGASIEDRFNAVLAKFLEIHPEPYRDLYRLLTNAGETSRGLSQRGKKRHE